MIWLLRLFSFEQIEAEIRRRAAERVTEHDNTARVTFNGLSRCARPDDELIAEAQAAFPHMKIFTAWDGRSVFEDRTSAGTIRGSRSVFLYRNVPQNPALESGNFSGGPVMEIG